MEAKNNFTGHKKEETAAYQYMHLRRAPPGRLGSSFIRFPAISLLFNDLRAASAALTS